MVDFETREAGVGADAGVVLSAFALLAASLVWASGSAVVSVGVLEPLATHFTLVVTVGTVAFVGVALLSFLALRYDVVERRRGAMLATASSLAFLGFVALVGVMAARWGMQLEGGLYLAAVAGGGMVGTAYLELRAELADAYSDRIDVFGLVAVLGVVGYFAGIVAANVLYLVVALAIGHQPGITGQTAIGTVGSGVGLAGFAYLYLQYSEKGLSYVDFSIPDRYDWAYVLGGVVGIFGLLVMAGVLLQWLGVQSTQHSLVETARQGNPEILLVLVPLSWLVIGPGEELVYRNIVQKELYGAYSRTGAIVIASALFGLIHFQAYATAGSTLAILSSLGRVFVLSLLLGAVYHRTENLTVPALVHGTFNALQFALLYASLTGMLPG